MLAQKENLGPDVQKLLCPVPKDTMGPRAHWQPAPYAFQRESLGFPVPTLPPALASRLSRPGPFLSEAKPSLRAFLPVLTKFHRVF